MAQARPTLRTHCDLRLAGLRQDRNSFWVHWRELAQYILPRRYKWVITPNQFNRGSPINQSILDSTGTLAARTLASGMMSGITNPARPWFRLRIQGFDQDTTNPVTLWLAECTRRMMYVMQESNFYTALAVNYLDLVVFGTSVILIYEDYDDIICCYNPCAGEYFLGVSDRYRVNQYASEFVLTIDQVVQWFGIENVQKSTAEAWRRGGAELSQEISIGHLIEPNTANARSSVSKDFKYREMYWEVGTSEDKLLGERGFFEWPGAAPRWDVTGNDAYGRSPGMDALPDIKQLQHQQRRKAQAIDKIVNPPLVADMQLKNQPSTTIPGGITYANGMITGKPAIAPVYQIAPQLGDMREDIHEVQMRVQKTFFNDLFLMISQLDTVRSATEIDARKAEVLVLLGPVLERLDPELLDSCVNRIFNIMLRGQLFPPPPAEIQGAQIEVQYSSMLAEAQRAVKATGTERLLAFTGNLAAVDPEVMDNIDLDEAIDDYASLLDVKPGIVRSAKDVAAIRAQRAQQQAQEQAGMMALAGVDAAKTLSETPVGGGQTALTQITQGAGLPGAAPI